MENSDEIDGCDLDMTKASTTPEQMKKLLGKNKGEPEPAQTEKEHEDGLRHVTR